ncbi:MAG: hypothetical protein LUI05_00460 [Oscillospiraceae bacterium]|nr:hypothetical protein [Oscillospiraceae bacterium]
MKLSYRDKVIFICAIVIVILVAGFFLFIKPAFEDMNSAKSALESKQSEQADVQSKIDTLPQLVETLKSTASEVEEIQSYFLTEQDPYLNEQFVHEILDGDRVTVLGMETRYTSASPFTEYVVTPSNVVSYDLLIDGDLYEELPQEVYDNYNGVRYSTGSSITIGVTTMTVNYRDSIDLKNVLAFADTISEYGKTMQITSLTKAEEKDNSTGEEDGSLELKLYSIYPLNIERVMEESDTVEIVDVQETDEEAAE